jgi:hypothetical protein
MKALFIIIILTIVFETLHSQENLSVMKIDSLIKLSNRSKLLKKQYDNPSSRLLLNKKTNELIRALIIYPKEKAITLYFWQQQLIKARVQVYSATNKASDGGIYYFDHGTTIFKREINIEPQGIAEIFKISSESLEKAGH